MANTLQTVLNSVAAYVNQDPTLPSGTDLTTMVNLINQSEREWSDAYQWKQLTEPFAPSVVASMTSIGLPANYKKMMSPVYDYVTSPPTRYTEIQRDERFSKVSTDKYVFIGGNESTGHYININPALASGASVVMDVQFYPSALATLADVVTCPSIQFLTLRTISKLLSARSDPRFPQVKADSDDLLSSVIEEEASASKGMFNSIPTYFGKIGFRPGQ